MKIALIPFNAGNPFWNIHTFVRYLKWVEFLAFQDGSWSVGLPRLLGWLHVVLMLFPQRVHVRLHSSRTAAGSPFDIWLAVLYCSCASIGSESFQWPALSSTNLYYHSHGITNFACSSFLFWTSATSRFPQIPRQTIGYSPKFRPRMETYLDVFSNPTRSLTMNKAYPAWSYYFVRARMTHKY